MATRDWPAGPQWEPQTLTWGARVPTSGWAGFYSGQRQRVAHLGHRQVVTVTLPAWRDATQAAAREAWLQSLVASGDLVRLRPWHRSVPLGNARGSMTLGASAAAGASSVSVIGAAPAPNMLLGGSFEVDTDANGRSDHMQSYITGSTGAVTFEAGPPLPGATGLRSQRITAAALGTSSGDAIGVRQDTTGIIPGRSYTMAVSVLSATACGLRLYWDWMAADGTTVLSNAQTTVTAPLSAARLTHTSTAPTNAASVRAYVWAQANPAPGIAQINLDDWQFEQSAAASAFAGSASLAAGDFLGVVGGQLLQAASAVAFTDAGAATVPLVLPLRRAVTSGTALAWNSPTSTFELAAAELAAAYTPGLVQQPLELTFVEAF